MSAQDWTGIRTAYEAGRYAVRAKDGGFVARRPDQQLTASFDRLGFTVEPDDGRWSWGLELASYGFPGHERRVTAPESTRADRRSRCVPDGTTTWRNGTSTTRVGLEHGFTVHRRPIGHERTVRPHPDPLGARSAHSPVIGTRTAVTCGSWMKTAA